MLTFPSASTTQTHCFKYMSSLRDLSKQAEDTPSFLLASLMHMSVQEVPRAAYWQFSSRAVLLKAGLTHIAVLTWNCCSWTQHLDLLHALGSGNKGCSHCRRCHATMAALLQTALLCWESDLGYRNTEYKSQKRSD